MNENLMLSNSTMTRENEVIGPHQTSKLNYNDVTMGAIASQITSLTIVHSIFFSDADRRKHQRSASLAFMRGFHRSPVHFPQNWPITRKRFSFDDVIMWIRVCVCVCKFELRVLVCCNHTVHFIIATIIYFGQLINSNTANCFSP